MLLTFFENKSLVVINSAIMNKIDDLEIDYGLEIMSRPVSNIFLSQSLRKKII